MSIKRFFAEQGRVYLPDLLCISFVVLCTTLIPRIYNQIPIVGFRLMITCLAMIGIIIGISMIIYRFRKRNYREGTFHWIRSIAVIFITLIITAFLARIEADAGLRGMAGSNTIYPVANRPDYVVTLIQSIVFAFASQAILATLGGGYEDNHRFITKLWKSLLYVGLPLVIVTFVVTRYLSFHLILQVCVTILLWIVALVGSEQVDGSDPQWIHRVIKKQKSK